MKTNFVSISGVSVKRVKAIAKELQRIQREQSVITAQNVLRAASNPSSVLHSAFQWNDKKAAYEYRLWQARMLIRSVYIVDSTNKDAAPVRAFVNVYPEDDSEDFINDRGYVFTPTIASKANYKTQVLNYALEQLRGWRNRFGNYKQFFKVVKEIDKL